MADPSSRRSSPQPPRAVVGVGASAGGVEALEQLFRGMPEDLAMAFVVVTHLAPDRESHLTEVIGRASKMPVKTISKKQAVQAGCIYVLPPNATVTLENGVLRLASGDIEVRERKPIDIFFASLAADQSENAIGVVLSGAGSDGTLGLKAIKEKDGLTVVQGVNHSAPRYPEMPRSAIEAGIVDLVLPVEEIGRRLAEYVRAPTLDTDEKKPPNKTLLEFQRTIAPILLKQIGHDFSGYKNQTFMRRVERRRRVLQLPDVDAYLRRLREDADEVTRLFRDLLIGVTSFFRDPDAFDRLAELVIPKLFQDRGPNDVVRVWVPACSTGEEVYSLAILLLEHMDKISTPPKVQVFGTDIDTNALGIARSGTYPPQLLEGVSPKRLARFFINHGTKFTVARALRDICIFSDHSLIRDPPFSRMDLVSCRNLLIYLGAELQDRIVPIFHYALRPAGFLFLGTSESATKHRDLFTPLDKKERIFQRRYHPSPPRIPIRQLGVFAGPFRTDDGHSHDPATRGLNLRHTVEQHVLEQFAPPHVVVNQEGNIIYYSARTGKYLEPAAGTPNHQLVASARKGLRLELRGALQEAMEHRHRVERPRVAVEIDDRVQYVNLTIEPTPSPGNNGGESLYLVLFTDVGGPLKREEAIAAPPEANGHANIAELERELRDTRERLQATIEEYETSLEEVKSSNEEMLSVNEEIQSTNEELESSKEELQSVNEELHTVNAELNNKIDELGRANTDLHNLFEATRIAIVFLDREFRIRNFTPVVTEIFNLIPTDHGRPLSDIVSNLDADLWDDIRASLATREPVERQIGRKGDPKVCYQMRVLPYWTRDHEFDGVLLTFVDVTTTIEAETRLRTLVEELNHRVKNMLAVVLALVQMSKKSATSVDAFAETVAGRVRSLASAYDLISDVQWDEVSLRDLLLVDLGPFHADKRSRVTLEGSRVAVKPKAALALGMIFHELSTNAVKYGALSNGAGRVAVMWEAQRSKDGAVLVLRWRESDGPSVKVPAHGGFGTELIKREAQSELKGTVAVEYADGGLEAVFTVPLHPDLLRLDPEPKS